MNISRKIRKYSYKLNHTNNPEKISVYNRKLKYYRTYNQRGGNGKDVYEGAKNEDGQPHGQGTMEYANGNKYVGEWSRGKMSGKGIMKYANGDIYDGNCRDGKKYGEGRKIRSRRGERRTN